MVAKDHSKTKGSTTKVEVGEIDTSAPFRSVKDAVSLFGEGAFSGAQPVVRKAKPLSAERVRVLPKETKPLLVQSELDGLKEKLKNAETTKADALIELQRAKETVEELTGKLEILNKSKDSAIRATEEDKHRAKQFAEIGNRNSAGLDGVLNVDPQTARVEFETVVTELDEAKWELRKIRQEYGALMEAKDEADKQGTAAERAVKVSMARVEEISREIAGVENSIQVEMLESGRAKEEETMICVDKEKQKQFYKNRLGELSEKLLALKKNIDPELIKNLETQLGESSLEIEALRNEMENKRAADLDSLNSISLELVSAKELLCKVAEEESSLRSVVETLKVELDSMKKEHSELKEKERKTELSVGNLHMKLRKAKSELEEAFAEEGNVRGDSDEMLATIHQLALESGKAELEAEEMKRQAEELREQAEETRIELEEAEKKLGVAIHEAEEAKAAEARSLEQIRVLSEKIGTALTLPSEPGDQITLSRHELESLRKKIEDSEKLAELKVAAAIAQVEAVKASETEAVMRLEATQKEIEEMKAVTMESLKKVEMAEAARKAIEGELRRWRERELKKAAESAVRILSESERSFASSPSNNHVWKQKVQETAMETRKLEKKKPSVSKKVLMPSLRSVLHKKNSQVEGSAPSYLSGEKPKPAW